MKLYKLLLILVFWAGTNPPLYAEDSQVAVITNVTIIDAKNGIRENQNVFFKRDAITKIQPASQPVGILPTIKGDGKYLIPGLWDFHVHLTYEDSLIDKIPELFLSYGITSVRDTGGLLDKLLPIVETMRKPNSVSPRVFYSGPLLDGQLVVYDGKSRPHIGVQNIDAQSARKRIQFLKSQGASFIKIYELVSPRVFEAMVSAAREHKMPIDSHVPLSMRASEAGAFVDSIEHLRNIELDCALDSEALHEERLAILKNENNLSGFGLRSKLHRMQRIPAIRNFNRDQCIATLTAMQTTLQVPTLRLNSLALNPPFERLDWPAAFLGLPHKTRIDWDRKIRVQSGSRLANTEFAEWSLFLVGLMKEYGLPIGAGTDTPIGYAIPGYSLHAELQMLVRAGLTPMQAIQAATLEPAKFFGLSEEMGTIDVNKRADMVLLHKDPLINISNTRAITHVISKGRIFTEELLNSANTY